MCTQIGIEGRQRKAQPRIVVEALCRSKKFYLGFVYTWRLAEVLVKVIVNFVHTAIFLAHPDIGRGPVPKKRTRSTCLYSFAGYRPSPVGAGDRLKIQMIAQQSLLGKRMSEQGAVLALWGRGG